MACILTSFHKNDIVERGKDQQHNFVNILYILIQPSVNKTFWSTKSTTFTNSC